MFISVILFDLKFICFFYRRRYPPQHQPQLSQLTSSRFSEYTTAVYTFCDEDLPYRSKIPGTQPTLRLFKDYLPKKGSFR